MRLNGETVKQGLTYGVVWGCSALDTLTRELREEENKNGTLREELAQLQRLVGTHQFNVRTDLV